MGLAMRWCGWKFTAIRPRSPSIGEACSQRSTLSPPTPRMPKSLGTTSATWRMPILSTPTAIIHSSGADAAGAADGDDTRRSELRGYLFDRLVRLGQVQRDEQPDDGPRRIDLCFRALTPAEFWTARMTGVVVVKAFTAGQEGDDADVRRGVVEVPVADVMTQAVD